VGDSSKVLEPPGVSDQAVLEDLMQVGQERLLVGVQRLKSDVLRLPEVVFQNVANMAPAASIAYDFPVQASLAAAGAAMALSNVIAFLAVMLIASAIVQFSRKLSSAGGFFTFVSRGLGKRTGAVTGLMFFVYAAVLPASVTIIWAGITEDLVAQHLHVHIPWYVWETAMAVIVTTLAYRGVRLSVRIGMIAGGIEIAIFIALAIGLLLDPVTQPTFEYLLPSSAPLGWSGVLGFGLVYGILSFVGFEAAAPLAEETRQPKRSIPRSLVFSALIMGAVYVLLSFAVVAGWGADDLQGFALSRTPFIDLANRLGPTWWLLIYFAMTNSSLACALASTNASARVMYSMGRVGLLPNPLGHVHEKHRTPSRAILLQGCVMEALAVGAGMLWGTGEGFVVLAVTVTIGAMIVYTLGNVALPVFYLREYRSEFSIVKHLIVPATAVSLLVYVVYRTVWPVPVYPLNVPAYAAFGWLGFSVIVVAILARVRPEAVARAGLLVSD
jgi:amino acid transporter